MSGAQEDKAEIVFCGIRKIQRKGTSYAVTLPKTELEDEIDGDLEEELEGRGVRTELREDGSFQVSLPLRD
jgi:antitoxin component of MazEF toxin-antitoxin module